MNETDPKIMKFVERNPELAEDMRDLTPEETQMVRRFVERLIERREQGKAVQANS